MFKRKHSEDTTDAALAALRAVLADLSAVSAVVKDRALEGLELIDYVEQHKGDDAR